MHTKASCSLSRTWPDIPILYKHEAYLRPTGPRTGHGVRAERLSQRVADAVGTDVEAGDAENSRITIDAGVGCRRTDQLCSRTCADRARASGAETLRRYRQTHEDSVEHATGSGVRRHTYAVPRQVRWSEAHPDHNGVVHRTRLVPSNDRTHVERIVWHQRLAAPTERGTDDGHRSQSRLDSGIALDRVVAACGVDRCSRRVSRHVPQNRRDRSSDPRGASTAGLQASRTRPQNRRVRRAAARGEMVRHAAASHSRARQFMA